MRAGGSAGAVRDSDQDLVPEQEGQGQEDGEGGGRPAVQVSFLPGLLRQS